jgi:ubiquitin C-terminal hydrolase
MIERFVSKSELSLSTNLEELYTLYLGDVYNYSTLKSKIPYNNSNLEKEKFSISRNVDLVIVWRKDKTHLLIESEIQNCTTINDLIIPEIQTNLNIQRCIEKYIEKEQMNEEELFFCSKCKEHKAPIKKLDLWSTPDVLILHLKRFEYIPGQYFVHRDKISDFVDYPLKNLDLSGLVLGPKQASPIYDLYAVSEHSGGLGGGHYTAKCKNHVDNNWYSFNDSFVSETSPENAVTDLAYLLFYKRNSGSYRWGGLEPLSKTDQLPDEE